MLQPKLVQSEFFTGTGRADGIGDGAGDPGVQVEQTGDTAGGGQNIGFIEPGDYWAHEPVSLANVDAISLRAASGAGGGEVSLRWDAPDGPEIGRITVPDTGGWQQYTDVATQLTNVPSGSGSLHLVLLSGGINANWMEIDGRGVTDNERPEVVLTVDPLAGDAPLTVTATAEATDPDGAGDLTYAWDAGLGDGFVDGTSAFEHTYDDPGTYRLQVRVTDEGGAYAVEYATVEVAGITPEPELCLSGRSDDFLGADLDPDRWTVQDRNQDLRVAEGALTIPASVTDFYGTNNVTVPNLVLQDLPDGPFTATAKVTIPAYAQYQQAGLLIYGDADNYAKMVVQGRSAPADPATRVFQYIREEAGAPNEVGDSNTAALGAAYPDTVFVRLASSDGEDLTASYSADGVTFTAMPQTKLLAGIDDPRIGLVALAGSGSAAEVVDARFDWFHITPDDTAAAPGAADEFDGDALDGCRWDVVREDPAGYRVTGGALEIDTTATDIYTGNNTGTPNIVVQDLPDDDWTVETRVDGSDFDQQYQQGGLIVYGDDDNYVKLDLVTDNAAGSPVAQRLELRSEVGSVVQDPQPNVNELTSGVWHLRLSKVGSTFTGEYSADGEEWTALGQPVTHDGLEGARVGLFALGAAQQSAATASFDYFRTVTADEPLEVTGSLSPTEPDGPDGQWLGPVTVTVGTTGGPAGAAVLREVDVDGGGWTEYTTPLEITAPGAHTVQVRASVDGVTVVGETLTFTIAAPDVAEATPGVEIVQPTCTYDRSGAEVVTNGALVTAEVEGVRSYVVREWVDGAAGDLVTDLDDLAPGRYRVAARPADGYVLVADGGWRLNAAGLAVLFVTLDQPECPDPSTPDVVVEAATCDAGGSITPVALPGVRSYVVHRWVDGEADGKPRDLRDLAPGDYRVIATPAKGTELTPAGDWVLSPSGKAYVIVTVEESCDR
nr:hypothetical protein GCM10025730_42840 [Promicromonospora thailandica]